jgi:hypothetical protein
VYFLSGTNCVSKYSYLEDEYIDMQLILYILQQTISGIDKKNRLDDTSSSQVPSENEDLDQEEEMEAMRETPYGIMVSERQPVLLEGGALRPYQLDGLDWLKVYRLYITLPVPEFLSIRVCYELYTEQTVLIEVH